MQMSSLSYCIEFQACFKADNSVPRKVLILGAKGLLGSIVLERLSNEYDTMTFHDNPDILGGSAFRYSPKSLNFLVSNNQPTVIVNCAAVTRPSGAIRSAFLINTLLPIHLAFIGRTKKIQVIHFSTNAVFSGLSSPNHERSLPSPRSIYGLTKFLGDFASFGCLIIRTSFIGQSRNPTRNRGLVDSLDNLGENQKFVIDENFHWNGVTADFLAEVIAGIISANHKMSGLVHLFSSPPITRLELVRLIARKIGLENLDLVFSEKKIPRDFTLQTKKHHLITQLWAFGGYLECPSFQQLIQEMKIYRTK
jgi:dTDP-4-dehydrorhamnose reductase